jgi:hypothetical protein
MLICGYDASTGNTSSRNLRNTAGLRNISDTGTDNLAITVGTSASSRSSRAVNSPTWATCSDCTSANTRRFNDDGA